MRVIRYFILFLLLNFSAELTLSQESGPEQIAAIDTSGPPWNPAQLKVTELMKDFSECSFIDWKGKGAGAGAPVVVVHNFDREWDSKKLYHLMEMSEDLSREWLVEKAYFFTEGTRNGQQYSDWRKDDKDSKLSFITSKTLTKLRRDGYLLQFKPFVKMNDKLGNGKLEKVPNWSNMFYFPTNCGTFVYIKYEPNCNAYRVPTLIGKEVDVDRVVQKAKIKSTDNSEPNRNEATKEYFAPDQDSIYYLLNVFPPAYPLDSIAEGFVIKRHQEYWENVVTTLEGTQLALEIVPFVAVARAYAQTHDTGWWEHKPIVTAADQAGFAADLLLDSIPVLSQASKFRKISKAMFIAGSVGSLSLAIGTKIGAQGQMKIDDYARLVVLAILSRDFKGMKLVDGVADAQKLTSGIQGGNVGLTAVAKEISTAPGFKAAVAGVVRGLVDAVKIPKNLSELEQLAELIKAFKLKDLPATLTSKIINQFTFYRNAFNEFSSNLAKNSIDEAEQALNRLLNTLLLNGKQLKTATAEFDLTSMIELARQAKYLTKQKIDQLGGNVSPDMVRTIYEKELITLSEKHLLDTAGRSINDLGTHGNYAYKVKTISIFDFKTPTHYYVFNDDMFGEVLRQFIPKPGDVLPYRGPNGEVVKEISNLADESDELIHELLGPGQSGKEVLALYEEASLGLRKANLLYKAEEFQHAANHADEVIGPVQLENGVQIIDGTGTGFYKTTPSGTTAYGTLTQRVSTFNCLNWIRTLSGEEIFNILKARNVDLRQYIDVASPLPEMTPKLLSAIRDLSLDPSELDIFMAFWEAGVVTSSRFDNGYLTRIFGQEFLERQKGLGTPRSSGAASISSNKTRGSAVIQKDPPSPYRDTILYELK